jgi:hypothetical protein
MGEGTHITAATPTGKNHRAPFLRRPTRGILLVNPARNEGGAANKNPAWSGGCPPREYASVTDAFDARSPWDARGAHHAVRFIISHRIPSGGAVRSGLKLPCITVTARMFLWLTDCWIGPTLADASPSGMSCSRSTSCTRAHTVTLAVKTLSKTYIAA